MCHETRQGFAAANQKFEQMNTNMTVLTSTLSTLHSQLQNTTHAMLGQREEKMISDKTHTIEMRLFDQERMLDRAQTDEERNSTRAKIRQLEETREHLRGDYESIGVGITNILTAPLQTALPAPPTPPGLLNPDMPPPPPPTPATPTTHRNNIQPPTPAPTPVTNNGRRAEPSVEESSPTKRQKTTNIPTRWSPRNVGTRPSRTSSESSVENAVLPKNPRKNKKDRALSVTTGSDVFGPTNVNNMIIDQEVTVEVSTSSSGECAATKVTCPVHPASRMMLSSHVSEGSCGSRPARSRPMPINSVDHSVNVLKEDAGCTPGPNISRSSCSSWSRLNIPHISVWTILLVCFFVLVQSADAMPSHVPT
jgi:hypothetical protein